MFFSSRSREFFKSDNSFCFWLFNSVLYFSFSILKITSSFFMAPLEKYNENDDIVVDHSREDPIISWRRMEWFHFPRVSRSDATPVEAKDSGFADFYYYFCFFLIVLESYNHKKKYSFGRSEDKKICAGRWKSHHYRLNYFYVLFFWVGYFFVL